MIGHAKTVGELREALAGISDVVKIDFSAHPVQPMTFGAIHENAGVTFYAVTRSIGRNAEFRLGPPICKCGAFDNGVHEYGAHGCHNSAHARAVKLLAGRASATTEDR